MALVMAILGRDPWLVYVAAMVLGGTAMTWNSIDMMAVLSASDQESAGKASGWCSSDLVLDSSAAQPPSVG